MKSRFLVLLLICLVGYANAAGLVSRRLEDSVRSNGVGEVNLMRSSNGDRTITAAQLEAFRKDNGGYLVFAVDVNEAANGTEKAESQGVAILEAWVDVRINNVAYRFSQFSTKTRSSLAVGNGTNRGFFYTLIGETGSSRITSNSGSDINSSSFDATLSIPMDLDISQASAAWLHVRLLQTNGKLGDPEAYYDYSGGYEDLAIITYEDATYLDTLKAGRSSAPLAVETDTADSLSNSLYYPSASNYFLAAYEDNFPKRGDYDFNDLVVAYRISFGLTLEGKVKTINGDGYLVAKGGSYNHDWYLSIALPENLPGSGKLTLYDGNQAQPRVGYPQALQTLGAANMRIYQDTGEIFFDPSLSYANTIWFSTFVPGTRFEFSLELGTSVPASKITRPPFDPFLFVRTTGYEIHLPGETPKLDSSLNVVNRKTNFKDRNGYPYAMIFPQDWQWPNEYVDLGIAYPLFIEFIQSGNRTNMDWYHYPKASGVTKHGDKWQWH